jgi:hypothetical protein
MESVWVGPDRLRCQGLGAARSLVTVPTGVQRISRSGVAMPTQAARRSGARRIRARIAGDFSAPRRPREGPVGPSIALRLPL